MNQNGDRDTAIARLDRTVRSACLSLWQAAADGGAEIAILDTGEVAVAASRTLPGWTFNQGIGFAGKPHLVSVAADHFRSNRTTGWVWTEEPPWRGAIRDGDAAYAVCATEAVDDGANAPPDLVISQLNTSEVGAWAEIIIAANEMPSQMAHAWRAMERELAVAPHDHRFIGLIDGRPVAAAAVHIYQGVGYLRAGSVLPEFRGRGIQRAMIEQRVRYASSLGCDLVGSVADPGSSSLRNLERVGLQVAAVRRGYRIEPI